MAHIEQRGNSFRLIFRYQDRRYARPLKTTQRREAQRNYAHNQFWR